MNFGQHQQELSYYEELELTPTCSAEDIKKSYRRLAIRFHPDKNPGKPECEEKFKKISEAYSILSDPEARSQYDKFGKGSVKPPNVDPYDLFASIIEIIVGESRKIPTANIYNSDIIETIDVTLSELYSGTTKNFEISRQVKCAHCQGIGCVDPLEQVVDCDICSGSGKVRQKKQSILQYIFSDTYLACEECLARGYKIKQNCECSECLGTGTVESVEIIEMKVEPGMFNGEMIVVEGKGNYNPLIKSVGNFIFQVKEVEHEIFKRERNVGPEHLYIEILIPLVDSLCGYRCQIDHPKGPVVIDCHEIIEPESIKIIRSGGMPVRKNTSVYGDLFVKFHVVFPTYIDEESRLKLENILPLRSDFSSIDLDLDMMPMVASSKNDLKQYQRYTSVKNGIPPIFGNAGNIQSIFTIFK